MQSKKTAEALNAWKSLKFGMFIHFGVYSMLGGKWKGKDVPGLAEWMPCKAKIPRQEYMDIAKEFNPVDWDPDAIAKLAHDSGMKYLVVTAKHHDGFALFNSKASSFNIVNSKYGRDLIGPLAEACRRHGVMPGIYYSQDLDWNDLNGGLSGADMDASRDFDSYLQGKVKPQLTELLSNYGEIGVVWFDTPINITYRQSKELADLVHSLQPKCIFNSRLGHGFGDFDSLGDNQVPGGPHKGFAETAGTFNRSWGYKESDDDWLSPRNIIVQLSELAAKGVNYLLNIGPDGTGKVPEECLERLREVGAWTRRCSDALYNAEASPFPLSFPWGGISTRGKSMYAFITDENCTSLAIPGVLTKPESVRLLGDPNAKIEHEWKDGILEIRLLEHSEKWVPVLEAFFFDTPSFDSKLSQLPDGTLVLPAYLAKLEPQGEDAGKPPDFEKLPEDVEVEYKSKLKLYGQRRPSPWAMQIEPGGYIENWKSTQSSVEWKFNLKTPGEYEVWVQSISSKYTEWQGGHKVKVQAGDSSCEKELYVQKKIDSPRSRFYAENDCRIGTISLSSGANKLRLSALNLDEKQAQGLALTEVKLKKLHR